VYHKQLDITLLAPPGGLRSEEYRQLVATSKVPALLRDGQVIVESGAILEYLEDCFPNIPLRATTPQGRAEQRSLISFMDFSVAPQIFVLFQVVLGKASAEQGHQSMLLLKKHLNSLEDLFVQQQRAANKELDMADCGLLPSLFYAQWLASRQGTTELFAATPHLALWWEQRSQLVAVGKVFREIGGALSAFVSR